MPPDSDTAAEAVPATFPTSWPLTARLVSPRPRTVSVDSASCGEYTQNVAVSPRPSRSVPAPEPGP